MVHVENGISISEKADRNEMPVMMPGNAMGRMMRSDMTSRPKKREPLTAAAHNVPSTSAISVAIAATFTDTVSASQTSGRFQVTASHCVVKPGGGHW